MQEVSKAPSPFISLLEQDAEAIWVHVKPFVEAHLAELFDSIGKACLEKEKETMNPVKKLELKAMIEVLSLAADAVKI
jgi:hypothetical protein